MPNNLESQGSLPTDDCLTDASYNFPDWIAKTEGNIPCPPKARGGCGTGVLVLRRILDADWVDKLIKNSEVLIMNHHLPEINLLEGCSSCLPTSSTVECWKNHDEVRGAAHRKNNSDNFLYCPKADKLSTHDFEHFQMHWRKGEPVIVRDVLATTSGLSWEPMVMWRAFRSASRKLKEEPFNVQAIDCFDWCEVLVSDPHIHFVPDKTLSVIITLPTILRRCDLFIYYSYRFNDFKCG